MILYHGSPIAIQHPDLSFARERTDFGKGFYATPFREQAISWARRFKHRTGFGHVCEFRVCEHKLRKNCSVLEFEDYSDSWLSFIISCRSGLDESTYDVVIGGVANDKVFDTVELVQNGLIDRFEALRRLQYKQPNLQVCLLSQRVIDTYLLFLSCEVI